MPGVHALLARQLDAQAEALDEVFSAIDDATDGDPLGDHWDLLYEAPLEVRVERSLVLVLATGGPHVEAVGRLDDDGSVTRVRLLGWWGGERIERSPAPGGAVCRALEAFAETLPAEAQSCS